MIGADSLPVFLLFFVFGVLCTLFLIYFLKKNPSFGLALAGWKRTASDSIGDDIAIQDETGFRIIFEHAEVGITLTKSDGTLIRANPFILRLLGYSFEELSAVTWVDLTHVDDRERDLQLYTDLLDGLIDHYRIIKRYVCKDGTDLWVDATVSALTDSNGKFEFAINVISDITDRVTAVKELREVRIGLEDRVEERTAHLSREIAERQRIEVALRASEGRFKNFAESASDWFWETGPDHRFTYFSERLFEVTGQRIEAFLGKSRLEVAGKNLDDERAKEHVETLEKHQPFRNFEYEYEVPDGTRQHWSISGKPFFDSSGEFAGYRGTGTNVTDAVNARKKADSISKLLQRTIDHMQDGVSLLDKDLNIVMFNNAFTELLQFPEDRFPVGTNIREFFRYNAERGEYGDGDIEELVKERVELSYRFEPHNFERIRPDGTYIEVRGSPVPGGGFISIYSDITERRRSEEALFEMQHRLQDIAESASDWFWEMDENLVFSYASERFFELTKLRPDQVIGMTRTEFAGEKQVGEDREMWSRHMLDLEKRRPFSELEYAITGGDGNQYFIQLAGKPFYHRDGKFAGYRGAGRDVTAERRAGIELVRAKEVAEKASRAKSDFLAKMSHELRTPLNAILGLSEMLLEDVVDSDDSDFKEPLQRIYKAGDHLLALINDILDLSKIEAGKMEIDPQEIDLSALLEEMMTTAQLLAKTNNNQLKLVFAKPIPNMVADSIRLKQILLNLLSNACKFTQDGEVQVFVEQVGEDVNFLVTDSGIGIDPDKIEKIFGEFTQAELNTARQYGGTGLGLAISSRLCAIMGGDIEVDSNPGQGTTFKVRLPLRYSKNAISSDLKSAQN